MACYHNKVAGVGKHAFQGRVRKVLRAGSYSKHGYNAVMVNDTSFLRNPHYHMPTDTIDTLNFEKMADVVNGVTGMLISLNEENW